jgi:hypothetical protein
MKPPGEYVFYIAPWYINNYTVLVIQVGSLCRWVGRQGLPLQMGWFSLQMDWFSLQMGWFFANELVIKVHNIITNIAIKHFIYY